MTNKQQEENSYECERPHLHLHFRKDEFVMICCQCKTDVTKNKKPGPYVCKCGLWELGGIPDSLFYYIPEDEA